MKKNTKLKNINWNKIEAVLLNSGEIGLLTQEETNVYYQLNEFRNDPDLLYALQNLDDANAWNNVSSKIGFDNRLVRQKTRIKMLNFYKVAAVLVIVIGVAFIWRLNNRKIQENKFAKSALQQEDVLPGGDRAVLLYNNKTLALDKIKNGDVAANDNKIQRTIQNGVLVYRYIGNKIDVAPQYDTVITPKGGQYALELEDGTKIWLNAASSISFPVPFNKGERCVNITGEAYFEVSKNREKPFTVEMRNGNKVTVLGTHFDVKAYRDDNAITTTLLEGKVEVKNENSKVDIKPGEQSTTKPNGKIDVQSVDVSSAVAWKNGYFDFNNDDLETVMKEISRWYNVDVVYENKNNHEHFYGEIQRSLNLSQILKVLEKSNIRFKIKNQTIIVDNE